MSSSGACGDRGSDHPGAMSKDLAPDDSAQLDERLRPLVVTADDGLLDDVVRLCAAAGVSAQVARDEAAARREWAESPLVIVGDDLAEVVAESEPGRRANVAVVTTAAGDATVWARAVRLGADQVHALPHDQDRLVEALAACLDGPGGDATLVAVVGGSGGAGASCFAGALALTASREGYDTLLLDADPLGGGIDMVLGDEDVQGVRWSDLAATQGRISGASLRRALPRSSGLSMLSWDRGDTPAVPAEAMRSVLAAARRSHDLVVVDVPRRLDPAGEEVLTRAATTLLVVAAEIRAVAAATRVLGQLRAVTAEVGLVVRGPGPTGLDAETVSRTLGLSLTASMRNDARIARAIDEGLGPSTRRRSALASASRTVLARLEHPERLRRAA